MTTACFDGETLAVSSLIPTATGNIGNNYKTLYAIGKGKDLAHAALCGEPADNVIVSEWLGQLSRAPDEAESPTVTEGFSGLVVMGGNVYELTDELVLIPVTGSATAGSGWQFAKAALDFGCNAAMAVEYAATHDTGTGGEIRSVRAVSLKAVKVET